MKLKIEIEFGNDAMRSYDRAKALIQKKLPSGKPSLRDGGKLLDINGNTVGFWMITSEGDEDDGNEDDS